MADGFGFGGEGDWKTAALVRIDEGDGCRSEGRHVLHGGLHLRLLSPHADTWSSGAHMLEICRVDRGRRSRRLQVHPLGIGGKADPVRLVFTSPAGKAVVGCIVDMGNRFRMIVNDIDVIVPEHEFPKLPVARTVWLPEPSLKVAAAAWIYSGGAHHTGFSQALTMQHMEDFAEIAGIELVRIDSETKLHELRRELAWSDAAYRIGK